MVLGSTLLIINLLSLDSGTIGLSRFTLCVSRGTTALPTQKLYLTFPAVNMVFFNAIFEGGTILARAVCLNQFLSSSEETATAAKAGNQEWGCDA
jgi:hypothetical protein